MHAQVSSVLVRRGSRHAWASTVIKMTSSFSGNFAQKNSSRQRYQQQNAVGRYASRAAYMSPGSSSSSSSSSSFMRWGWGLAAATAALGALSERQDSPAEACGIVGVIGEEDARSILMEGLTVLQNRGYDSAGIATISPHDNVLTVTKYASAGSTYDCIDLVKENSHRHKGHHVGIAHTRWATHGGKTDLNAHPHTDSKGRVAVVHNGTITNSHELRHELQHAHGIKFVSETDTEIIAQLIGLSLDENLSLKDATAEALKRCDGTWGLVVLSPKEPDELVVACNGSPMVLGIGEGRVFIASETSAFNRHTKNFIALKDGELGVVRADGSTLDLTRVQKAPDVNILLSPAPYPHWTIRECMEQPEAIARALGFGGRMSDTRVYLGGLDRQKERMQSIKHLVLTGCGTSLHAAMYAAKMMRDFEAFRTVMAVDAAEVRLSDLPKHHAGLLAISQSGETKDVHRAVVLADRMGLPTMSVVNTVGSLIARTTKLGVYLNAGRESSVASTKAFTTQVTVLTLITAWFRQVREEAGEEALPGRVTELLEALQRMPIGFGMARRTREQCAELAVRLKDKEHVFLLGKGYGEPIALEGALKLKEMAYIHAEGYSGGALKHGPFALIEGKEGKFGATPIICLILDDEHAQHMRTAAEEVKARGADLIVITDNPKLARGLVPDPIIVPNNGPLTALIATLPLQLLAYELAVLRGINPDKPRNLAKAVTVD